MMEQNATPREGETEPVSEEAAQTVSGRPADEVEKRDPEELRRDIEQTRSELGDTAEALAQKTDVKARVSEKVDERKAALRERQEELKAKVGGARERVADATPDDAKRAASQVAHTAEERPFPAIAVALAVGFVLGWLLRRR
jgi:ElaB/YqjD/DUF883 family membrane-anchored ribosome-binding protein